jgi:hypothetical protein
MFASEIWVILSQQINKTTTIISKQKHFNWSAFIFGNLYSKAGLLKKKIKK